MVHAVRTTRCDIERGELLVERCATTASQNLMENCCSSCYHFDLQIFVKHAILHQLSLVSPPLAQILFWCCDDVALLLSQVTSHNTLPLSRSRPNLIINRALQFEVSGSRRAAAAWAALPTRRRERRNPRRRGVGQEFERRSKGREGGRVV